MKIMMGLSSTPLKLQCEALMEYFEGAFIELVRDWKEEIKLFRSWRAPEFDILNWWKVNGVVYPTLQAISRDVLAIPISIVASESAFSNSGRILSPHLSRLNWTTVEALMCARSWLWAAENNGIFRVVEEIATVLNEMESDDEAELMEGCLGYHFED
ncbi:unnamed protein product [Vicia faba]|uniref:HAT C-terminal dimerisation domain-containing protein n=1 Tax=Vicia faba TaxID=3906 RepID=A0AAV0YQI2_VICFA|nr:unnamed protein product [Vicia faba]